MKEARIEVRGRVQGVHFRNYIKKFAEKEEIMGSAMNLSDGGILIVAQGERDKINQLLSWLEESPGFSKVENIEVNWSDINKTSGHFKIVREGNFFADKFKSISGLVRRIFRTNWGEESREIPRHVAIIPDGNRRWARYKGIESHFGHYKAGSYGNVESLLGEAKRMGVTHVSIWGFSSENWKRSSEEKKAIFELLSGGVERFMKFAKKNKMRFIHIGRKDRLPKDLIRSLEKLEKETLKYKEFNVLLCLDYGGRDELIRAVNKILEKGIKKVDEKDFAKFLDTKELPDPDLIIRTSGEKRISGFMPFQSAYAELYFSKKYFPDFGIEELHEALREYGKRERRFGGN